MFYLIDLPVRQIRFGITHINFIAHEHVENIRIDMMIFFHITQNT